MLYDAAALRYGCRPTDFIDPHHQIDDLTRGNIDVAIALRARLEESRAYREEMEKAKEESENPDIAKSKEHLKRMKKAERASDNKLSMSDSGQVMGGFSGRVGQFDPKLAAEYVRLGGTLPKKGEGRDERSRKMLEERHASQQAFLDQKPRSQKRQRARVPKPANVGGIQIVGQP